MAVETPVRQMQTANKTKQVVSFRTVICSAKFYALRTRIAYWVKNAPVQPALEADAWILSPFVNRKVILNVLFLEVLLSPGRNRIIW